MAFTRIEQKSKISHSCDILRRSDTKKKTQGSAGGAQGGGKGGDPWGEVKRGLKHRRNGQRKQY